jgi:calcium/calmodulin-dependent protein kinase I
MLPFQSDEDDVSNFVLFSSIKKGKYSFPDEWWSDISNDAKDFIAALLNIDPEKRPTAAAALEHRWLTTESGVDVLPNVRKNFSGKKTFKRAVTAVRATLGMSQSQM